MGDSKDEKKHEKRRDSVLEKMLNTPPDPKTKKGDGSTKKKPAK